MYITHNYLISDTRATKAHWLKQTPHTLSRSWLGTATITVTVMSIKKTTTYDNRIGTAS